MIRVGFIMQYFDGWQGGRNYYKNLFYAISTLDKPQIEIVVFTGTKMIEKDKDLFQECSKLIVHKYFDNKSFVNILGRVLNKLLCCPNYYLSRILKQYKIDVLSHSSIRFKNIRTIGWIPDFQHIHLPQFFSEEEINSRNKAFSETIQKSDGIILSSYAALNDLNMFTKEQCNVPVFVLHFVSQPNKKYFEITNEDKNMLLQKYGLQETFFYLPNQLWAHKNHITVFKAAKELKSKGISVCIALTGHLEDYRNKEHIQFLRNYITDNHLTDNIKILGLIDYEDVFLLIKFSKAVINPSLFEGWSSTVEECKSVGKSMILSNLAVHKEQYPNAVFFEKEDSADLAEKLEKYDEYAKNSTPVFDVRQETMEFAKTYEKIVLDVMNF